MVIGRCFFDDFVVGVDITHGDATGIMKSTVFEEEGSLMSKMTEGSQVSRDPRLE
jgi:hypothetical protein